MTKPCGCCQEAELRTGLVRVELEGGEYFYARRRGEVDFSHSTFAQ